MALRIPTVWQNQTLEMLIEGWLLLWEGDRIYWRRIKNPEFFGLFDDTIECGEGGKPKTKAYRMSHMEKHGWVIRTAKGWEITDEGREATKRYDEAYRPV